MHDFRRLDVWRAGLDLAREVHILTRSFPGSERYGLVQQMRRAAVSVPSNIAEGCGRRTSKDQIQFLSVAMGSVHELETQVELSREFDYLTDSAQLIDRCTHIRAMLRNLIRHLETT